jgi:hypothetical protein
MLSRHHPLILSLAVASQSSACSDMAHVIADLHGARSCNIPVRNMCP